MKKFILSAGLAAVVALSAMPMTAQAGDYYSRDPYDQCMSSRRSNGVTGGLLGAVAGGLAGSGIASSKNREEGAILGAVVGAVAGNAIGKSNSRCSNVQSYGYSDEYRSERYSDYRDDRYNDDYDRGYRESAYREDDYYEPAPRRSYGDCKVVYSTTRLPDGMTVREPSTYCRSRDGAWTRRN
jgi:hypothetical protein